MNKEVEVNTCEAFLKSACKRKGKQLGQQQWKHHHRFANGIHSNDPPNNPNHSNTTHLLELYDLDNSDNSFPNLGNDSNLSCGSSDGVSLSETGFKTDDGSRCLDVPDSSTTGEFRNEDQELFTCELNNTDDVLNHENNVFKEEVGILLDACRHSEIRTKDFYIDKIKSLHKNHIQVWLEERKKCSIEFEQAQTKRKKNRLLIITSLDSIAYALRLFVESKKCSGLQMNKFIAEQRKIINGIRSKLDDSVCCDMRRLEIKKNAKRQQKSRKRENAENVGIRKQLLQTEIELLAVKNELADKVSTIRQHSNYEHEKNLEISKLKEDVNMYKIQLIQIFGKTVCKELIDKKSILQCSLENNANVSILMTETKSGFKELYNDLDDSNNFSKPAPSHQKRIINVKAKEALLASEQVAVTQCQLPAFHHKGNSESSIQKTFNSEEKFQTELSKLQTVCKELIDEKDIVQCSLENNANINILMTETESGFKEVHNDLNNSNNFSESAPSRQKGIINVKNAKEAHVNSEQVAIKQCQLQAFHKENSASSIKKTFNSEEKFQTDLSKLQTYLVKTPQVLEVEKRILSSEIGIQQKFQHVQKTMEHLNKADGDVKALQNQLAQTQKELEAVKKELSSKINIIQQKFQLEQKTIEQLNKAEDNVKGLQNQLAQTQNELEAVKKELNDKVHIVQQKILPEQTEIELCTVKTVELLQSQLTGMQQVLENVKKTLNSKINIIEQKVQHEQKIMEQLNKSEEDKKILQDRLDQSQNKLEDVKKELNKKIQQLKKDGLLQTQLTLTQQKLEETRKGVNYNLNTMMQKHEYAERITKEKLSIAEVNVKLLRSQLVKTQRELETVRKELNDRANVIQQEQIEKAIEIEFSKIRMMLIKKLCLTHQNDQHLKNYMKERSSQGIASDIQRLIEDKVQLRIENITEAVIQSNILKVTENELHLLILVASVLKVVPFSASTDFIYSFVAEVDNVISHQHVESLLKKFPTLFKEESVGAGSSNKNWRYLYLKPIITI